MVKGVAFGDDALLATGSADGSIRLWQAGARQPALLGEASVGEATNFVHAVAFSPDGQQLASGEKGGVARVWDVRDPRDPQQVGEPLGSFTSWVNTVAFAPDGQSVVAGSSDGSAAVFAVADGRTLRTLPNPAAVTGAVWVGQDGLLTSQIDGVARLWPVPGPQQGGFADTIWSILPSADGQVLAVAPGTADGSVHLRSGSGAPVALLTPPAEASAGDGAAGMSADGRWVAAGTATGNLAVWERDPASGQARSAGVLEVSAELVESVAIDAGGTLVGGVADDGAVGVWRLVPGGAPALAHRLSVPGLPLGVTFSPDGGLLAVGTTDGQVHLWRLGGEAAQAEELAPLEGFDNYVYGLAFDPTGRYLAAGSTDRTVRIWDLADPAAARALGGPLRGPGDTVTALDWSADGGLLAGASKDGSLWLWAVADPAAPVLSATLRALPGALYAVALPTDAQQVLAGGAGQVVAAWQTDAEAAAAGICARTGTPMTQVEWEALAPGAAYDPPCPAPAQG
jgi:WD40 repeat protein